MAEITKDEAVEEKKNNGRKGRRPNRQERRSSRSREDKKGSRKGGASGLDNIQIIKDAANFPFGTPLGSTTNISSNDTTRNYTAPGVIRIGTVQGTYTSGYNAPLNISARNMFAFEAHANSRDTKYTAPDVMIYNIGVGNLFAIWNHCIRAYGVMMAYSALNRYAPESLLIAMNFDPDDLRVNANNFRLALNVFASKASTLVIPSAFAYTSEVFSEYSQVFADAENTRSQLYVKSPSGYYVYNETKYETGGCLEFKSISVLAKYTCAEWIGILNEQLNALLSSSSVNIMAADIIKAFGTDLYGLFPIEENYQIVPTYDAEVLEQINNIRIYNSSPYTSEANPYGWDLHQVMPEDTNLGSHLAWTFLSADNADLQATTKVKNYINTFYEDLSPAQVVHRTKYQTRGVEWINNTVNIAPRTHFVRSVTVISQPYQSGVAPSLTNVHSLLNDNDYSVIAALSNFQRAPMLLADSTSGNTVGLHGDIDNITFVDRDDMRNLDEAVIQVLFNVATVYPVK